MRRLHAGRAVNILLLLGLAASLLVTQRALAQTATIAGTVIDAQNGRSIPWANVVVRNAKRATDARSFLADSGGRFLATNIKPGSYILMADHAGYYANPHKRSFHPVIDV